MIKLFDFPRIKLLAKENGLSITFICKKLNMAKTYFHDLEKTGRDIPDDKIKVIADILDTTPEYLRGKTDIKAKEKSPSISDEDIKVALFGGDGDVSDEAWEEVKRFAAYAKEKYGKK